MHLNGSDDVPYTMETQRGFRRPTSPLPPTQIKPHATESLSPNSHFSLKARQNGSVYWPMSAQPSKNASAGTGQVSILYVTTNLYSALSKGQPPVTVSAKAAEYAEPHGLKHAHRLSPMSIFFPGTLHAVAFHVPKS